jgi:hypothetical protein
VGVFHWRADRCQDVTYEACIVPESTADVLAIQPAHGLAIMLPDLHLPSCSLAFTAPAVAADLSSLLRIPVLPQARGSDTLSRTSRSLCSCLEYRHGGVLYSVSALTAQETHLPTVTPILRVKEPSRKIGCFFGILHRV